MAPTKDKQLPAVAATTALAPVMQLEEANRKLAEIKGFVAAYLSVKEGDYGIIPGTGNKPCLLKPGADKLVELYGLETEVEVTNSTELWTNCPVEGLPLFDYTVKTIVTRSSDGRRVGVGLGSCNSYESKYRYRVKERQCPECGLENIRLSKEGGWYCWKKQGGCGGQWPAGTAEIEKQDVGKKSNPDIADQKNTILKMAKKRSMIDAVIAATRTSGIFTQDVEELKQFENAAANAVVDVQILQDLGIANPIDLEAEECQESGSKQSAENAGDQSKSTSSGVTTNTSKASGADTAKKPVSPPPGVKPAAPKPPAGAATSPQQQPTTSTVQAARTASPSPSKWPDTYPAGPADDAICGTAEIQAIVAYSSELKIALESLSLYLANTHGVTNANAKETLTGKKYKAIMTALPKIAAAGKEGE